ncbi:MAG: hypothetical protein GY798_06050 [Hyphomicrobiales bacterium]|nr:hypothetical protein [Hyphomicrobiales bacterium]
MTAMRRPAMGWPEPAVVRIGADMPAGDNQTGVTTAIAAAGRIALGALFLLDLLLRRP